MPASFQFCENELCSCGSLNVEESVCDSKLLALFRNVPKLRVNCIRTDSFSLEN